MDQKTVNAGRNGLPEKLSSSSPECNGWLRLPQILRWFLHLFLPKKKASMRSLEIEQETKNADGSSRRTKLIYKERR